MATRTKPYLEHQVVQLLAQRTTYTDIAQQTGLSVSGIKKIKHRNNYKLQVIEKQLIDYQVDKAKKAHMQAQYLIHAQLDQAEAGLIIIPLAHLLAISREMHRQTLLGK